MTVSTVATRIEYTGTGSTVTFAYPFRILSALHLAVSLNDVPQTLTTHYTVAGVDDPAGGTVTFLTAPAAGVTILLARDTPATQLMNLVDHDPQPAETVERAHDKAILLIQELDAGLHQLEIDVAAFLVPGPAGSLLGYVSTDTLGAILPGTSGQVLAMVGGMPTWSTVLAPGTILPINQPGDLVVGASGTGEPTRLASGPPGHVLTVSGTGTLFWDPSGRVSYGAGQCRLVLDDPNLRLIPYHGNQLWIEGTSRTIPVFGVTLAVTGLAINTSYYIYAAWIAETLVLEASTVSPTFASGYYYKTGDASRASVGFVHVIADGGGNPTFIDTPKYRCILSMFNQEERVGGDYFRAPRSTTSVASPVELHDEIRAYFLAWSTAPITIEASLEGSAYPETANTGFYSFIGVDGTAYRGVAVSQVTAQASTNIAISATRSDLSDGLHYITLMGQLYNAGTVTWHGDSTGYLGCRTQVSLY